MKGESRFGGILSEARGGSDEALGRLLDGCRRYLLLVANCELEQDVQPRFAPSDLVQETFLEAQRDFRQFTGETEDELLRWLRRILLNNLRDAVRHHRASKRCAFTNEVRLDRPGSGFQAAVPVCHETPGSVAAGREDVARLRAALNELPAGQRRAVVLRNFQRMPFADVGRRLDRSPEAARKLWARAIRNLQEKLEVRR